MKRLVISTCFIASTSALATLQKKDFWDGYDPHCGPNLNKKVLLNKEGAKGFGLKLDEVVSRLRDSLIQTAVKKEFLCQVIVKDWKAKPKTAIALAETQLVEQNSKSKGYSQTERCLWIGLFSDQEIAAKTKYCVGAGTKDNEDYESSEDVEFSHFDFAPYRISFGETAFGVRVKQPINLGGNGGGANESLFLFLPRGDQINLVLKVLMKSSGTILSSLGKDGKREGPEEDVGDDKGTVIKILDSKTQGYNDLQKLDSKGRTMQFKWNGSMYETHDKEIVYKVGYGD